MQTVLIDTDIIIDYLRGHTLAIEYLEKLKPPIFISVVTIAEIYAGIRSNHEEKTVANLMDTFEVFSLENITAITGGQFVQQYAKSHGTGLADALIAATALHHKATLVTLNTKHFPMIKTIKPYKK